MRADSKQYIEVTLTIPATATVSACDVAFKQTTKATIAPTDWIAADLIDGKWCVLVGPGGKVQLAAGRWYIYARPTSNPEIPALECAGFVTVE